MNIAEITSAQIKEVYSGRQGCMCGCNGKYSTDSRQVTRVLNILKNDPRVRLMNGLAGEGKILYIDEKLVERNERNYVAYLKV